MKKTKEGIGAALGELMYDAPAVREAKAKHQTERERLDSLPKGKTVVVSFRVPASERDKLTAIFAELEGLPLSEGVRRAVYYYVRKLKRSVKE